MLQWLYMYISSLSPMFHLLLRRTLQACLDAAYVFTHILEVFYLDIVYVCNCFQMFLQLFQMHVQVFRLFFLYVASVASECFKNRLGVIHGIHVGSWRRCGTCDVRRRRAPRGCEMQARVSNVRLTRAHAWTRENELQQGRLDAPSGH
jgi:hypothetical protein